MDAQLAKFDRDLFDKSQQGYVKISSLQYDDVLRSMFARANPKSGLRASGTFSHSGEYSFKLLALQSPIIAYAFRNHYRLLAGAFTLDALQQAVAQKLIEPELTIPIVILDRKPTERIRRYIIQFDLTENLLSKCFISDTKKISFFLASWFVKDEGKRSIFQSQEWLAIFPHLNTSEKVAKALAISKKDL